MVLRTCHEEELSRVGHHRRENHIEGGVKGGQAVGAVCSVCAGQVVCGGVPAGALPDTAHECPSTALEGVLAVEHKRCVQYNES